MNFGRVLTAMITPFDKNGEVDYEKTARLAEYLLKNGSDGIVVTGTTGESPTLTCDEKIKVLQAVKEAAGKAPVIAGTCSNNTQASVELTKRAEKAGADGILAVTPYYNKPPQEALYRHFKTIADCTSLPIVLYNIPGRSVINIQPETVARLAKIENIVCVKESSGVMDIASNIQRLTDDNFSLYSGEDSLTMPLLGLGAVGVVSVASHLVGKEIHQMVDLYMEGKHDQALKMHLYLMDIFKKLFIVANPIPLKYALNKTGLLGFEVGSCRMPLIDPLNSEKAVLDECLCNYGLL